MKYAVWYIAGLHLILAIFYALQTPYREGGILIHQGRAYAADIGAPDERQHVNYVAHLASGKGFPIFNPEDKANLYESYQSHQPPLFYILASGVAKITGGENLETRSQGLPLRIFNAVIGAMGVAGVYFFILWGLRNPHAALTGALFAALLPMNAALSGAVSNDPLLYALSSWCLAVAAKAIREGWNLRLALIAGGLAGLAFLTKTTAIALWPALAVGFFATPKERSPENKTSLLLAALALPLLIAAPWWFRNQSLYGDPLAMKAFTDAFTGSPQASLFIQQFGAADYWLMGSTSGTGVFWWTLRSFFGAFGYMDIFFPNGLYWVFSAALVFALVGRIRVPDPERTDSKAVRTMGLLFFFVVLALFLRFNSQYFQGQARYVLPAIAPISAAVGLGVYGWSRSRPAVGIGLIAAVLTALNVYALSMLPGEFERRVGPPPTAELSELPPRWMR